MKKLSNIYNPKFRVVFCGKDQFLDGYLYTKKKLNSYPEIEVNQVDGAEILSQLDDIDVIVPYMHKIDENIINHATKLKMIMQFGVGLEGINLTAATNKKIPVCRIPSYNTGNANACAEHAIYLALSVLRKQKSMIDSIIIGSLGYPTGRTLTGSSALIFGFGNIGYELGNILSNFRLNKINALKLSPWNGSIPPFINQIGTIDNIEELANSIDLLFVCCTQNPNNIGIINKNVIKLLNDRSFVINIARVIQYFILCTTNYLINLIRAA